MLRIAVELPAELTTPGELLADVQAYEAAGADTIWLAPGAMEPLMLLAAVAGVTSRAQLATPLASPGTWPAALLVRAVTTLERLSRRRVVLSLEAGPETAQAEALTGALRARDGDRSILMTGAGEASLRCAARLGDGLVWDHATAPAAFARVRELRRPPGRVAAADAFELWARTPAPGGRAEWRELLAAGEGMGATGLVVLHAPNLLDILRNPEEDDRQDLGMAVG
jgi:alkanesulfonate monooxygenase SsuD/methylene tetrahydromethanopterin reductase-like flavin-dependent oxidoreductase (luciferase family)